VVEGYESLAKNYFAKWNAHDLVGLKELMHPSVVLWDWENKAQGLEQVIQLNADIFLSAPQINAEIINLFTKRDAVGAELKVNVTNIESIDVFDILKFNQDGKIILIKAFKC